MARFSIPISTLCLSAVLFAGTLGGCRKPAPVPLHEELTSPALVFTEIEKRGGDFPKRLFFTRGAAPFLKSKPQWISGESLAELTEQYDLVSHQPKAWRALDREKRFDALLLMGDPASFRPLLDHLRRSPDWTLTYLDATSYLYQRSPAKAWTVNDLKPLEERFAAYSKHDQVALRVQLAHRLIALEDFPPAERLLDEAIKLDPDSPLAQTELAFLHASQGRWEQALENATKALKADPDYPPALAAKANALLAYGRFNEALHLSRKLVALTPQDGTALYLHAKVTHAARAFKEEIEVLNKIIADAQKYQLPTGSWRVFLGQAHASTGNAEEALAQFELAVQDPTLLKEEREFADKAIERLKNRERIE